MAWVQIPLLSYFLFFFLLSSVIVVHFHHLGSIVVLCFLFRSVNVTPSLAPLAPSRGILLFPFYNLDSIITSTVTRTSQLASNSVDQGNSPYAPFSTRTPRGASLSRSESFRSAGLARSARSPNFPCLQVPLDWRQPSRCAESDALPICHMLRQCYCLSG